MRWHFLQTAPASGAHNMAVDEALMRRAVRAGHAVFRVYGWSAPTLSLGRHQRARGCYDEAAARSRGISFVRRPTGGRALLHDREVTYSVTMPASGPAQARAAYSFINEVLLEALARLGVAATRAPATAGGAMSPPPGLRPCFDVPSAHEIVLGDRKLVGSAQWCRNGGLLQHGSILIRDDQEVISELVTSSAPSKTPVAATLADALGWEPHVTDLVDPLRDALTVHTGAAPTSIDPEVLDADELAKLTRAYSDSAWTWRR